MNLPFKAYNGDGEYIFISYKHKDSDLVYPVIEKLHDNGFNIWYDAGLPQGKNYDIQIANHIKNSSLFINFITKTAMDCANDEEDYMIKEFSIARNFKKPIFPIYLEDVQLDGFYLVHMLGKQSIFRHNYHDDESLFIQSCIDALKEDFNLKPGKPNTTQVNKLKQNELLPQDKSKFANVSFQLSGIKKYVDEFFNDLTLYQDYRNGHSYKDYLENTITNFINNPNQYTTFEVYTQFFSIYQSTFDDMSCERPDFFNLEPNYILHLIELLKKYDSSDNIYQYSVNVFLLGLAIYAKNKNYKESFKHYVLNSPYKKFFRIDGELSNEEFLYRWAIASLFNNLTYTLSRSQNNVKTSFLNEFKEILNINSDINDLLDLDFIQKVLPYFTDSYTRDYPHSNFLDLFKPTDIMAHKVKLDLNLEINQITGDLKEFKNFMKNNDFVDDSYLASVLVLNSYGYLLQKYEKDSRFFFYPLVDSATAILLNSYYSTKLQKNPFNLGKLRCENSPLSYLLILCSELLLVENEDILFECDDQNLTIEYTLSDKDELILDKYDHLDMILDLYGIFNKFNVNTRVEITETPSKPEVDFSYPIEIVERIAIELSKNAHRQGGYNEIPFHHLSSELKLNNLNKAKSLIQCLNSLGYVIVSNNDPRNPIDGFNSYQIHEFAECLHEQWCLEKFNQGWRYGPSMNREKLETPNLVFWNDLPIEVREINFNEIGMIFNIVRSLNLKIVSKD